MWLVTLGFITTILLTDGICLSQDARLAEARREGKKPKLSEVKLLNVDPEELERRTEEIKKRFVEFFGA